MWSNISPHVPGARSESQTTIGIVISRNTERAEATVALAITVQPDLKMRSRETQSSWLGLTDRTTLLAASIPGDFFSPLHPWFAIGSAATFPPNRLTKPRVSGGNGKKYSYVATY